ncbi:PAS domain-containing protein [Limnoglobus roseus]|uniref:PAS domain-containing protein n=1 Tax=Limnoglobus roseus TaxID=2598579 RepID=UPI00143DF8A0|nr:PAS domain S-box protein [Limnoglobus roseus]
MLVEVAADHAVFALDPAGRVASWSPCAELNKGYAAPEIIGRHFSSLYPPEARDDGVPARLLETARSTGRAEDEGWRQRKDGSRFWAEVVISPLRDCNGELIGYGKVTCDRTERRAADAYLRAGEQRFRMLAEHTRDVIFRFEYTPAPRYSYVSPAIRDLVGYALEEFYLDPAAGLRAIHPDDQPAVAARMAGGVASDLWVEALRNKWATRRIYVQVSPPA